MKAPIFIVGAARSGTGLLRNLVRSHPAISIPGESHFVPHFFRAYGDPADEAQARRLARRILSFSRVRRWGLEATDDDFADCRSYAAVVDRLFRLWADTEGKPRWGDKTPHYVSHLPTLQQIFPDARILHIIRDGRAVALSWSRHAFGAGNLYSAARQWRERVESGRVAGGRLPAGCYLEVRYESLLADTPGEMRRVYEFLGEVPPSNPAVLNPPDLQRHDPLWTGVSQTEVVAGNADAWKDVLRPDERRIVEAAAGRLLADLGYPVDEPAATLPAWRRATWSAHTALLHYARQLRRPRRLRDNAALFAAGRRASRRTGGLPSD